MNASESGGVIVWRAAGSYLAGEAGIYDTIMPDAPAHALALTLYPLSDRISDGDTLVGAQFRYASKSMTKLLDIEDALMNSWSRRAGGTLGSVKLVQSSWASGAPLGQDGSGRIVRSVNYYLTVHRPNGNDNI